MSVEKGKEKKKIGKWKEVGKKRSKRVELKMVEGIEGILWRNGERIWSNKKEDKKEDEEGERSRGKWIKIVKFKERVVKGKVKKNVKWIEMGEGGDIRKKEEIGIVIGNMDKKKIGKNKKLENIVKIEDWGGCLVENCLY